MQKRESFTQLLAARAPGERLQARMAQVIKEQRAGQFRIGPLLGQRLEGEGSQLKVPPRSDPSLIQSHRFLPFTLAPGQVFKPGDGEGQGEPDPGIDPPEVETRYCEGR
jgi:hypothetical protein